MSAGLSGIDSGLCRCGGLASAGPGRRVVGEGYFEVMVGEFGAWMTRSGVPELDSLTEGRGCVSWSAGAHGRASALRCLACHHPFPQELWVASPFPLLSENGCWGKGGGK